MSSSDRRTTDTLGDRMKAHERRETERRAMRGVPLVVRVDGRSFSRFTRGMARPFDQDMADLMVEVARYLVEQTQAKVALTQSDEISLVLEPFDHVGIGEVRRALGQQRLPPRGRRRRRRHGRHPRPSWTVRRAAHRSRATTWTSCSGGASRSCARSWRGWRRRAS